MRMRLARYLAHAGVASRRRSEEYIRHGRISVNNQRVLDVTTTVDTDRDRVNYDGKTVALDTYVYYIVHKPIGYVCSLKDRHADKLVTQLVPAKPRVYPVGRLDKDSSGLLIMTNDGDLAAYLTHPRHEVKKIYEVTVNRPVDKKLMKRLAEGIRITEGVARADQAIRLSARRMRITLHQGWKRQIRRMLRECGYEVVALKRISEGTLKLGSLPVGSYKTVLKHDILS